MLGFSLLVESGGGWFSSGDLNSINKKKVTEWDSVSWRRAV